MVIKERWLKTKASLDAIKAWHAIIVAVAVAGLFSFYGPRASDDRQTAIAMAVLEGLKDSAIKSCNEAAKEDEEKVTFSRSATFDLVLQEQGFDRQRQAVVIVREADYVCGSTVGGSASVGRDEDEPTP